MKNKHIDIYHHFLRLCLSFTIIFNIFPLESLDVSFDFKCVRWKCFTKLDDEAFAVVLMAHLQNGQIVCVMLTPAALPKTSVSTLFVLSTFFRRTLAVVCRYPSPLDFRRSISFSCGRFIRDLSRLIGIKYYGC